MILELPLEAIEPSPHNPRRIFEQTKLQDLAESIKRHGVLQPIRVLLLPGATPHYRLIAGERRWRASQLADKRTIPALLTFGSAALLREVQFDENFQREQLSFLEEAQALRALQNECGYSIALLAQCCHRSEDFVRDRLALLTLSPEVQQALEQGKLTLGAALALRPVPEHEPQSQLAQRVIEGRLTIEKTKQLVKNYRREQRQAALQAKREQEKAWMICQLSKQGPVITPETYQPGIHHRIWDLHFPECAACPLKGNFIRPDLQLEDVCVTPACYDGLVERAQERQRQRLEARTRERSQAFRQVLQSDEVLLEHLHYQLWVLLAEMGPFRSGLRDLLGLPPYADRIAAREADWQIISSWTYEQALSQIIFICVNLLAGMSNDRLPQGLKQSLIVSFGLPPQVLGELPSEGEGDDRESGLTELVSQTLQEVADAH